MIFDYLCSFFFWGGDKIRKSVYHWANVLSFTLLLLVSGAHASDTQGLFFERADSKDGFVLYPELATEEFSDGDWDLVAAAIEHKQQTLRSSITVFLVGHTVEEAYESARPLIERLESHKVKYDLFYIPENLAKTLQAKTSGTLKHLNQMQKSDQVKLNWSHLKRDTNSRDWLIGSMMATTAGVINANMWLYQTPIEPHIAWALIAASALPTFYHTLYIETFDRVYKFKLLGQKIGQRVKMLTEVSKRQLVNLFYAQMYRMISGPVGQASSALTMQGQAEIFSHVMAMGLGSSIFSTQRTKYFENDRNASRWVNFYNFLIMAPLVIRDISGQYLHSWNVGGVIDVHDSTLTLLAANLVMAKMLAYDGVRSWLKKMIEKQENWIGRLKSWVKKTYNKTTDTCLGLLSLKAP